MAGVGQRGAAGRAQSELTQGPSSSGCSGGRACRASRPGGAGRVGPAQPGPGGSAVEAKRPGRSGSAVEARRPDWQPCGSRSVPARSRPAPGQPAAASGLSSWEQRWGSSSSGSSSVQCRLTLLRIGSRAEEGLGWGEKRAGSQRPGVSTKGARGESVLSRPMPPSLPPSLRTGQLQSLTLSGISAGEGVLCPCPVFLFTFC